MRGIEYSKLRGKWVQGDQSVDHRWYRDGGTETVGPMLALRYSWRPGVTEAEMLAAIGPGARAMYAQSAGATNSARRQQEAMSETDAQRTRGDRAAATL